MDDHRRRLRAPGTAYSAAFPAPIANAIAEDRAAVERDRRAETYVAVLAKAATYRDTVAPVVSCLDRGLLAEPLVCTGIPADDPRLRCAVRVTEFGTLRNAFQTARNAVYYYGSEAAENAAALLAGVLPSAVGSYVAEDARRFAPDWFGRSTPCSIVCPRPLEDAMQWLDDSDQETTNGRIPRCSLMAGTGTRLSPGSVLFWI